MQVGSIIVCECSHPFAESHSNSLYFVSHLVRVRVPTSLRLTRTVPREVLKQSGESEDVCISCIIECTSDVFLLVDNNNSTVRFMSASSCTTSTIFRESTQEWVLFSALLVGDTGNERLLIPESKGISTSKRLVVATRATSTAPFTHTYDIPYQDDSKVGSASCAHLTHIILTALFSPAIKCWTSCWLGRGWLEAFWWGSRDGRI